jgi:fructokinase
VQTVIAFGEALVDLIYRGDDFVGACAGGSIVNSSVSLARTGNQVQLITEFGDDDHGRFLKQFLSQGGVLTDYAITYPRHTTATAKAVLDTLGKASYTFHKDYPEIRFPDQLPEIKQNAIFLFGSFSALDQALRPALDRLLHSAIKNHALMFYDPNIRKHCLSKETEQYKRIVEYMSVADIVRASDEDMFGVFGTADPLKIWQKIGPERCRLLVITHGGGHVQGYDGERTFMCEVPPVAVVSTIGAGDAFNAGMIHSLIRFMGKSSLCGRFPVEWVNDMLACGLQFASEVCRSESNYVPELFRPH